MAKLISGDGTSFDGVGLTVDVERALTADEQAMYYNFTLDTDPQIQRAVSTAQYLSGSSTVTAMSEQEPAVETGETPEAAETPESPEASGEAAADSAEAGEEPASSEAAPEE